MNSLESLKKIGMQLLDEEVQKSKGTGFRRLTEGLEQYKKEPWYNKLLNLEGEFDDLDSMKLPRGVDQRHVSGLVRSFVKFMEDMESGFVPKDIAAVVRDINSDVLDLKESIKRLSRAESEQMKCLEDVDIVVDKLSSKLSKLT